MKAFLRYLLPAMYLRLSFGGSSSSSSASSSSTTNNSRAEDNRQVLGDGSIGASSGGVVSLSDMSNRSFTDSRDMSTFFSANVQDSSDRSTTLTDQSNRSVNNSGNTTLTDQSNRSVNTYSQDPGALKAMETSILANKGVTESALNFALKSQDNSLGTAEAMTDRAWSFADSSMKAANSSLTSGFSQLLSLGKSMFDSNVQAVQQTGALTTQAYRDATAEKSGSIDNKTITILGLAAAAAVALFAFRKR